jgi:flagellar hook protein FlgE
MASLLSSLYTGVSGLSANSEAMGIIGDNISNVNTVGFKSSKAVFSDLFSTVLANGSTTRQLGRGSQLSGTLKQFSQGAFEASSNALDMALDGSGFFVVNNGQGNQYTRAGQFRLNDNGLVQTVTGQTLQGQRVTNGIASSTVESIDLAGVQSSPEATTAFTLGANLDSSASSTTTFNSPISIYNSVGTQVVASIKFDKVDGANSWKYSITTSEGSLTSGASGTVSFDSSGNLNSPTTDPSIVIDYSGSASPALTQTLSWDLVNSSGSTNGKLTGFAASSNNNSLVQDGFSTGTLVGLTTDSKGIISGLFNNGQTDKLFQVTLGDFLSPTGLQRAGSNLFSETADSGQVVLGTAGTGGFGGITGQSLELSNVDLAEQFVTMIQTQQAFQASARIITTADDLMTEAVNLVR